MNKIIIILLLLSILLLPNITATLQGDTKHYYRFDETSGTTLYDDVRLKNATATTSAMINKTGIIGRGVESTASTSYINFDGLSNVKGFNFWVYPYSTSLMPIFYHSVSYNIHINDKWSGNQPATTSLGIMFDNKFYSWTQSNLGLTNQYFPTNTWTMISIFWNSSDNNYYASINGDTLVASTKYGTPVEASTWTNFYFAKITAGDNTNARIDELGVFNASITQDDIVLLYNDGDGFQYPFTIPAETINITSVEITANTTSVVVDEVFSWDTSYLPVNATNVSLIIDFDDAVTSTADNGTYAYDGVGLYNLSVNATDGQGNSVYDYIIINVSAAPIIPPEPVNMSNVTFTAVNDANDSITGFSVSVNEGVYFGTATGTELVFGIPENDTINQLFNLSYSKFGYYTSTYEDINLSTLAHEGTLVAKTYAGDESLDDKAVIWIIFALVAGIGVSAIFSKPMLIVFGFAVMFLTYFLGSNIMVSYYWFNPLGYILGAVIILTGMLRLGFGD